MTKIKIKNDKFHGCGLTAWIASTAGDKQLTQ